MESMTISKEGLELLVNYDWEGNIRELKNIIERMVILAQNKNSAVIGVDFFPDLIRFQKHHKIDEEQIHDDFSLNEILERTEISAIKNALGRAKNNKAKAAKMLGIPRSTLYFKMEKHNIGEK